MASVGCGRDANQKSKFLEKLKGSDLIYMHRNVCKPMIFPVGSWTIFSSFMFIWETQVKLGFSDFSTEFMGPSPRNNQKWHKAFFLGPSIMWLAFTDDDSLSLSNQQGATSWTWLFFTSPWKAPAQLSAPITYRSGYWVAHIPPQVKCLIRNTMSWLSGITGHWLIELSQCKHVPKVWHKLLVFPARAHNRWIDLTDCLYNRLKQFTQHLHNNHINLLMFRDFPSINHAQHRRTPEKHQHLFSVLFCLVPGKQAMLLIKPW